MEVNFRAWRAGDDDEVLDILLPQGWLTAERYRSKFADSGIASGLVLVAESGGVICGHLMVALRTLLHGQARLTAANIGMVVVREDYRGLGVGSELLDRAIKFAISRRVTLIWLNSVPESGPAFAMYQRRGFEIVQGRLFADVQVEAPDPRLRCNRVDQSQRSELLGLRRALATATAAVQEDHYDTGDGSAWWLVADETGPVAAAACRPWRGVENLVTLLFDPANSPAAYVHAVGTAAKARQLRIHGSPAGALARQTPHWPWHARAGYHMVLITSLTDLFSQLTPFAVQRASEIGLRSARLALSIRGGRLGLDLENGRVAMTDSSSCTSELEFLSPVFASVLLGARSPSEAADAGELQFKGGDLDLHTAAAWLFPFRYAEATQLSEW